MDHPLHALWPALLSVGALFADWIVYRILAGAFALLVLWAVIEFVMIDYRLIQAWRRARQSHGPEQVLEGVITGLTLVNPSADEDEQRTIMWLTRVLSSMYILRFSLCCDPAANEPA